MWVPLKCYRYYFELTLQRAKCAIPRATSTAIDVFICSVKPLLVLFPSCCLYRFKKSSRQPFSASSIITSRWSRDKEVNGMKTYLQKFQRLRAPSFKIFSISVMTCKITFLIRKNSNC